MFLQKEEVEDDAHLYLKCLVSDIIFVNSSFAKPRPRNQSIGSASQIFFIFRLDLWISSLSWLNVVSGALKSDVHHSARFEGDIYSLPF